MHNDRLHILSTKRLGSKAADRLASAGITADEIPFTKIEAVHQYDEQVKSLATQKITAIFTSQNAVENVASILTSTSPEWTIYCTEPSTKEKVTEHFPGSNIKGSAASAAQLAELIISDQAKEIFFFCGDQRRDELPVLLRTAGKAVKELVVYQTIPCPLTISDDYDGILFFSPGAVKSFYSLNVTSDKTKIFAIGRTTAAELSKYNSTIPLLADMPAEEKMIDKVVEYFLKEKNMTS